MLELKRERGSSDESDSRTMRARIKALLEKEPMRSLKDRAETRRDGLPMRRRAVMLRWFSSFSSICRGCCRSSLSFSNLDSLL